MARAWANLPLASAVKMPNVVPASANRRFLRRLPRREPGIPPVLLVRDDFFHPHGVNEVTGVRGARRGTADNDVVLLGHAADCRLAASERALVPEGVWREAGVNSDDVRRKLHGRSHPEKPKPANLLFYMLEPDNSRGPIQLQQKSGNLVDFDLYICSHSRRYDHKT